MTKIVLFNKPYGVMPQFTDSEGRPTLADFIALAGVYPAGRLDRDSEGLMVLTDDGHLQHEISHPRRHMPKTYWVQVEGIPATEALEQLRHGVQLKDGLTAPAEADRIEPPPVWERTPPVRYRALIPTTWISLTLREGRNRQIRRMTAAVGHPTLRLIRYSVGPWNLGQLPPGEWQVLSDVDVAALTGRIRRGGPAKTAVPRRSSSDNSRKRRRSSK